MRPRGRKHIKTRCNSTVVKDKRNVFLPKSSRTQYDGKWSQGNKEELCKHTKWKGSENGCDKGEQQNAEISEALDIQGDQVYSPGPIHPGSIQGLPATAASASKDADTSVANAAELKEEEPPF
jgi:hypothetical protein